MNLRDHERASIRAFVQRAADEGHLSGAVVDLGCGTQPYRDIVEAAGGNYYGYDRADFPGNVSGEDVGGWGIAHRHEDTNPRTVLCTQVVQYVPDVPRLLWEIGRPNTTLVMTYPTCWPEVEPEDLHRFTKAGMTRLLTEAGFTILRHDRRAYVFGAAFDIAPGKIMRTEDEFALGYGVVARA